MEMATVGVGSADVSSKSIRVAIKGEAEPTMLTLVVTIPEPGRITPAMLVWEKGEAGKAKTISVQAQRR